MRNTLYRFVLFVAVLACLSVRGGKPVALAVLGDTIAGIASECPGQVGVALIVNDTDTLAVNNSNVYPMMSVFKLHQALAVCKDFDRRGLSLDTVLTFGRSSLDPATWSPMLREHAEATISLPVRELLLYTLTQSDNNASNLMFERLVGVSATDSIVAAVIPRSSFRIAYTEGEMSREHAKAYDNTTSPLGAAALINRLFTDSLVCRDKQEFLKSALGECKTGNDRIAAPLPLSEGVTIAHKTGSGYSNGEILAAHNDVAYVTLPDGTHYALAVFVKDIRGNEALAAAYISRISSAVYRALTSHP